MLEAMAANCPVLATDSFPCARSFLEQRDGCAIIERADPSSVAALIDHALAAPRPTGLRAVAERYSIANGIASHLAAMSNTTSEEVNRRRS
jgi:glycosyltransferase involved in cell wall biosynthesis